METPGNPQDKPKPQSPDQWKLKKDTETKKKKTSFTKPKPKFQPEIESGWFCCGPKQKKY